MTNRFTPWPKVSSAYGAPMGRMSANLGLDPDHDAPADVAISGPVGEYDAGGAYWGLGGPDGPVWAVWRRGKGREGVQYVRARSRGGAIAQAMGS